MRLYEVSMTQIGIIFIVLIASIVLLLITTIVFFVLTAKGKLLSRYEILTKELKSEDTIESKGKEVN